MATKRVKRAESIDGLDIALARAVDSDEARILLEKQARLIDSQETLARADLRHRGWQIIGERVGALLKALTVAAGLLALFAIVSFFWKASQAEGMVMDPFSVPPEMNHQGLTGSVVAQQLLDKISALENSIESVRASSSYENSWADTKGVTVPYAGVSLGELRREARDWLGSEKHLSGDVIQLPGGRIAISFRTLGSSGRVEGLEKDYDALLQQVAMQVLKATQPYRYAVLVGRAGNDAEKRAVLLALSRGPNPRERLWALHGLALMEPTQTRIAAVYRRLLAIDPNFTPAVGNIWGEDFNKGHLEAAFKGARRAAEIYRKGAFDYTPDYAVGFALDTEARVAGDFLGDYTAAAELQRQAEDHGAGPVNLASRPYATALYRASAHDFAGALEARRGAALTPLAQRADYAKLLGPLFDEAAYWAFSTDDQPAIAAAYRRLIELFRGDAGRDGIVNERDSSDDAIRGLLPNYALALARSGQLAEARAAIASLPDDNDGAYQARAFIAALSHDPRADASFAEAVRRTPSLPWAQALWAEAKLRTGDAAGAIPHAAEAATLGPKNANSLRVWGRALLATGKPAEAAGKFALAVRNAPAWGSVRLDQASALWQAGRRGEAVAALKEAATRTLSAVDRASWRVMVANVRRARKS